MIRYDIESLTVLDNKLREKLLKLTLDNSSMAEVLENRSTTSLVSIAFDDSDEPVGWSTVVQSRILTKQRWAAYVGVFVKEEFRRLGIGTKLVNLLKEELKTRYSYIIVVPHDGFGYQFFKKLGTKPWKGAPEDDYTGMFNRRVLPLKEQFYKVDHGKYDLQSVLGFISEEGDVVGSKTALSHSTLLSWIPSSYGFRNGDIAWQYYKDEDFVRWWEEPLHVQKELVEFFLKKYYGITVNRHILHYTSPRRKQMAEIKELIMEGVREKAVEDYISKIIKGTEWEGKVFVAGGYVRDEFMGKDPKDLDLLVNAPNGGIEFAKWITKKIGAFKGNEKPLPPYPKINYKTQGVQNPEPATEEDWAKVDAWQQEVDRITSSSGSNPVIFPRFGTAKFNLRGVVHNGVDLSDMDIEAVMPRKEQYTAGSRKPTVTGGELKDDVERRDFTVNSLLKDLSTGEILDLTGMGKADIKAGIVRTPLNPDKIFTDDPLRMLRAIRFAVKYQWNLPMFMLRGLKKNAAQLKNISQERIRDELNKMLVTNHPSKAIKMLKVTGLLPFVIPELLPAIKMMQNKYHKHDVFDHTLDVLGKTQPVLIQRLMGLFHDIGKTVTKTVEPETQGVHFYGHEEAGEKIVEDVMNRLKYPRELIDAVKLGVRNHMRLKQAGDTGVKIKDNTLLRFRNDMGEQLENILNVIHADNIAHSEAASMPNQIEGIRTRLKKLSEIPNKPKLPISGKELIALGLKPGPIYTEILKVVTDAWYENPSLTKEEALEIVKKIAKL